MRRDDAYLLDILLAARRARSFVQGLTWDEFVRSDLVQSAVLVPLEIIGEAARRVSEETRQAHPEIPWAQMIGMRNRLIHEYFQVVWDTLRVLLEAKSHGLVKSVGPLLDRLEGAGIWITPGVRRRLLSLAGEGVGWSDTD